MNEPEPALEQPRARAPGRFVLFRVAGLEVEGHVALLPLLALVGFVLATGLLPEQEQGGYSRVAFWLMGLAGALLLFASVLVHELAHALTARLHGMEIRRVSVFFHATTGDQGEEPETPGAELVIAGIGPASSLVLGGCAWALGLALHAVPYAGPLVRFVGISNLLLGLASLIPALPLDGGRILRALFWLASGTRLRGTHFACVSGRLFAAALATGSIAAWSSAALGALPFWGLALALVTWFQAGATWRLTRVREGLRGLTVGHLMEPLPTALPRQVSVQDALFDPAVATASDGARAFLVEYHGRLGGVVTLRQLRAVPEESRRGTPVWEVTTRLRHEHLLAPDTPAEVGLQRLREAGLPLLPVLTPQGLAGVLRRRAIDTAIRSAAVAAVGAPG